MSENMLQAKKDFSRFALALFVVGIVTVIVQILLAVLWELVLRDTGLGRLEIMQWLLTMGPMYLIAVPIGVVLMKKIPPEETAKHKLTGRGFLVMMLICMPIMYGGNYIGTLFSALFSGGNAENPVVNMVADKPLYAFIFAVLLAPFLEEFIFRKQLIDRLGKYGERIAIFFSAITFGLFHMNLFQFFYAFGLGLIFAYVYTRTRMLRYPVLMHMIINFMGSVLAPMLVSSLDMELTEKIAMGTATAEETAQMLGPVLAFDLYVFLLLGSIIAGVIFLIRRWKKRIFLPASSQLPYRGYIKVVYWNPGMLLFTAFCLIMIILALF